MATLSRLPTLALCICALIFGSLPKTEGKVEIIKTEEGYEKGWICSGNNVQGEGKCIGCKVSGPEGCSQKCLHAPTCVAWTLRYSGNLCWLKTSDDCKSGPSDDWVRGYPY